ncbi:unnamed protein product [Paramecium primaurelia]|uniref:Uncharacterized protein n=1 Tax=Paramecium primaurelia TaxID=5886 RepID=A0A8S1PX77_PARPR|nr:unnamed protein product [Paramecium primaurelia]
MNFTINEIRKSGTHTEEELNQLTLDENMGELRRAQYILQKGHPIQKYAIYSNIHRLFKVSGFSLLFPIINEDLVKQDEDTIAIAIKELLMIAKQMKEKEQQMLLNQTFYFMKNYNLKLSEGWFELFEMLYCCDIHNSIKLINELTDIDADTHWRQRGARLLQYIPQIEKIQLLCMDKDPQVRFEIVKTIQIVYCTFTPEKFSTYLQMKIFELIYDYEVQVRMAAIEMFFMVQSHLQDREKMITKQFFEFLSSQNVQIITIMSRICGKVLMEIMDVKPDIQKFLKVFISFADNTNEEYTINFAYNFPAILQILKGECYDQLKDTYLRLMQFDTSIQVRNLLLASIPDVISTLKIHKTQSLIPLIRKMLDHQIIQYNLYSIIYALWPSYDQQEQLILSKMLVNDILIDLVKQLNYKANIVLLEQLLKLHEFFQQCDAYLLLLCPLQNLLSADSLTVRTLATQNIAYLAYHDQSINSQMINLCMNSHKFRMRICYIDFISQTIDLCSKRYFHVNNFINILALSQDKIFDVRIKLSRIMKKIQTIILDNDETACIAYDKAIKYLSREPIINEILKQNESLQFSFGDDLLKEQKEHLCFGRISADDIDAIEKNDHTGSISPFIIKSKNGYGHSRKRSSITRQPVNRSQPNASFTQKLTQISTKYNPIKIQEDISRRTSVPPVPGRKLQLTLKPTNTQFKPKLNQQRLRK